MELLDKIMMNNKFTVMVLCHLNSASFISAPTNVARVDHERNDDSSDGYLGMMMLLFAVTRGMMMPLIDMRAGRCLSRPSREAR